MTEHHSSNSDELSGEEAERSEPDNTPGQDETQGAASCGDLRDLVLFPAILPSIRCLEHEDEMSGGARDPRGRASKRFAAARMAGGAAVVAVTGMLAGAALLALNDHHRQADLLTERTRQTEALAKTVDALSARLNAIESDRSRDELIDLRRSVGEMKSSIVSSHELTGALTQISQRLEKLDREESAKVDKLGQRVDTETNARSAELAARIEKLEKKAAAPQPTSPVAAAASPKQPAPPKLGPNVSMETTGSIQRERPVLSGYVVLGARYEYALVGDEYGERAVRPGDFLPGAGRVERIERRRGTWVVLTDRGLIASAEPTPY
jgi:hypothetical protein